MRSLLTALRQLRDIGRTQGTNYAWRLVRPMRASKGAPGRLILIGPRMESSGAPLVLLDIMRDFARETPRRPLTLISPVIDADLVPEIDSLGVTREPFLRGVSPAIIGRQLRLTERDQVLLNTASAPQQYRDHVLGLLESDSLGAAVWFLHEMEGSYFDDAALVARVARLLRRGRLTVVTPSAKSAEHYNRVFSSDRVRVVRLRVTLPAPHPGVTAPSDFEVLRFCSVGTSQRGHKGQFLTIAALARCLEVARADPERYRDFTLDLVGAAEVDPEQYHSRQMGAVASGLLGDRVRLHTWRSRAEVVEIESACNVTIGSSFTETFGLSIAEGMLLGHVLVRNATGGVDEQLRDGVNGVLVDPEDVRGFGDHLLRLLDRRITPNQRLWEMSSESHRLVEPFSRATYAEQLGAHLATTPPHSDRARPSGSATV